MTAEILKDAVEKFDKTVEAAKEDFATVRSGRANPNMFNKVMVDYYGSPTPITQLASIQVPEARTIMVNPYDKSAMKDIEQAIRDISGLNLNPNNDGNLIRINLPELTEERRKEYVKVVRAKAEEARVSVRNIRRKAKDELDAKKSEVGEDEVVRAEKELDQATKARIDAIDEALKRKEAELLEV